jgi:hypothetical protein
LSLAPTTQQTTTNPDLIKDQGFGLFLGKSAIIGKTDIERTNADF